MSFLLFFGGMMRKKPFYHLLELLSAFSKRKQLIGAVIIMALALIQSHGLFSGVAAQTPHGKTALPLEQTAPSQALITVDHNSIALFDQIPDPYIQAAANLNMLFIDRSVGGNINDGLDCLAYESDEAAPHNCSKYEPTGNPPPNPFYSVDPSVVSWFHTGGYDRSNWDFLFWEQLPDAVRNANGNCSSWDQKTQCFIDFMGDGTINQYDVVSYQFSYLMVVAGATIANQPGGFFADNANLTDVFDQEAYEAQHPDKTFIYWTTSLARSTGTTESTIFNNQTRQYANDHGKILFDVADILSHDPDGNLCYDNRDGVAYSINGNSENYPDDGLNLLAICPQYTTEIDGGHLGNTSAGKIRVAKGFWVLMAQIAGWNPGNTSIPPRVVSISPSNGSVDVAVDTPPVINFSEAMNTGSISYTLSPNPGGITPSWNVGGTQLTLTHNNFSTSTNYTLTINSGTNLDGIGLENVPYSSAFTSDAAYADLSIAVQIDNPFPLPGDLINVTLTVTNAGPTYPVLATLVDQWASPTAVSSISNLPANCQAATNGTGQFTGIITCSNINLTAGTPSVNYQFTMHTSASFFGSWYNQATITANDPQIVDAAGNNFGTVIINPYQIFLPIILK